MTTHTNDVSLERGRDAAPVYQSSGRGGLGNIRPASAERERPHDGPDDFSPTRGREMPVENKLHSTGRGGAGNIRSPSHPGAERSPSIPENEAIEVEKYRASHEDAPQSFGRGGLGNMSRSRSRPRTENEPRDHQQDQREHGGVSDFLHKVAHPREALKEQHHSQEHTDPTP